MRPISDTIEDFIKALMEGQEAQIELRRNELAQYFQCAPSQINYVLATRFTQDHGYLVESRRGGGGYIRIIRIACTGDDYLHHLLRERIGSTLSPIEAEAIISGLVERELVTPREAAMMRSACSNTALAVPVNGLQNTLRAAVMRGMISQLACMPKEES